MTMEFDLKEYIGIIRKRIWLIVLLVFISCTATGLYSYMVMKPVYEATTKLIVNSANSTGMTKLDLNAVNTNISLVTTYKEIIKTPAIMNLVAERHPEFALNADQLIGKTRISSVNDTQVITVTVQDASYEKAAHIVNAVSQVFQSEIPAIMKVDNVFLLTQADPSKLPKPVKPDPKLNIALGFVASLILSLGIALLLEYFDDRLKTEEDVQRYLKLPTLIMITHIREEDLNMKHTQTPLSSTQHKVGEPSSVSVQS